MGELTALVVRRALWSVVVLFVVVTGVFFFMRYAGDPVFRIAGADATPQRVEEVRAILGLDRPAFEQYVSYLQGLLRGDLGTSFRTHGPVLPMIMTRIPATLQLASISLLMGVVIAVPIGIYAALRPGSLMDSISRTVAVAGQSVPDFWLGILLIILLSVHLGWLPSGGRGTLAHMVLPAATLTVYSLPLTMRLTRSSMLDVLHEEYVTMARARGVRQRAVIVRHALRNALIPVVTVIALRAGTLLTGSLVVETVFGYPGLGRLAIDSLILMDYYVVQGMIMLLAIIVLGVNLLADILYGLLDPRVRVR